MDSYPVYSCKSDTPRQSDSPETTYVLKLNDLRKKRNLLRCKRVDSAEKETQKGKYKNPKVQKFKRCEIVKSNNRIM